MAAQVEVDPQILIKFAQKLAGNEKKTRDVALKKFRRWLESRTTGKKGKELEENYLNILRFFYHDHCQ